MEVAFQAEAEDSNIGMCLVHIKSGKEARVWGGGSPLLPMARVMLR